MARLPRVDVGGEIYHVINRANGRIKIFNSEQEYKDFEFLLIEMKELFTIDIFAYVLMPNHWHVLLRPKKDGDLSRAMQWLGTTHTRRVHARTKTIGGGHLYQGRYKSFLVQGDKHVLVVLKYIERNPVRAKLVKAAERWKWGSMYRRSISTTKESKLVTPSPVPLPRSYAKWINEAEQSESLADIQKSISKGIPYGTEVWRDTMVERYNLKQAMRKPGRPRIL